MNIPKGHLWQRAAAFAARAHHHHLRKDHQTPYISHPVRVAMTVACIFHRQRMQIELSLHIFQCLRIRIT